MRPDDPLLLYWRSFGDWGFIIVIIGVIGEVLAALIDGILERYFKSLWEKWKSRLGRYETLFGAVLIMGLAMEYTGHKEETYILDFDNAVLHEEAGDAIKKAGEVNKLAADANKEAGEARRQAGEAIKQSAQFNDRAAVAEKEAAQANERTAIIESTNLVLRTKLVELENRIKDRTVGQTARRILKSFTRKKQTEIAVRAFQSDREAVAFGREITDALNEAGISANFNATAAMNTTNTGVAFVVKDTDDFHAFANFIMFAFKEDGIKVSGWYYDNSYATNLLGIYVFPKPSWNQTP